MILCKSLNRIVERKKKEEESNFDPIILCLVCEIFEATKLDSEEVLSFGRLCNNVMNLYEFLLGKDKKNVVSWNKKMIMMMR